MNNKLLAVIAFISGTVIGCGATYFYFKKEIKEKDQFIKSLSDELGGVTIEKTELSDILGEIKSTVNGLNDQADDVLSKAGYVYEEGKFIEKAPKKTKPDINEVMHNVFPTEDDDVPYTDEEIEGTDLSIDLQASIYVITEEDFNDESLENDKASVTWYEPDDMLLDDNGNMIPDHTAVVGREFVNMFGYGSENSEICYVRNDAVSTDFEIVRVAESYTKKVFGDKVAPRKRKRD